MSQWGDKNKQERDGIRMNNGVLRCKVKEAASKAIRIIIYGEKRRLFILYCICERQRDESETRRDVLADQLISYIWCGGRDILSLHTKMRRIDFYSAAIIFNKIKESHLCFCFIISVSSGLKHVTWESRRVRTSLSGLAVPNICSIIPCI